LDTCGGRVKKLPCLTTSEINKEIGLMLTSKFILEKLEIEKNNRKIDLEKNMEDFEIRRKEMMKNLISKN
jgi:hypothetical protein